MRIRWTVRHSLLLIAGLGLGLGLLRVYTMSNYLYGYGTVYSPGYSESRFNSIRKGMTRQQVETIMGPPLTKTIAEYQGGDEMWAFSDQPSITSNYWQRWVIFNKGQVSIIVKDFWID
jgi:SmpA / OmlA family